MKKTLILTLLLASFISSKALAEVQFLPEATENMYQKESPSPSGDGDRCTNAGYIYTSCEGAMADECPYRAGYYRTCCPAGYTHKRSECTGNISSDSCAGYYKCDATSLQELCANEGYTNEVSEFIALMQGDTTEPCPHSNKYYKIISSGERCLAEGYRNGTVSGVGCATVTCPYNSSYTKMDCSSAQACMADGYSLGQNCPSDQMVSTCPQNSLYTKCISFIVRPKAILLPSQP